MDAPPPVPPPLRRITLDLAVTGSMALLALFVSAYTVYVQRQQLKVQAWPRLAFDYDIQPGAGPDEQRFAITLKNRGVAPADVRSMRVVRKGKEMRDWYSLLDAIQAEHQDMVKGFQFNRASTPVGSVIGVGESFTLLETTSRLTIALVDVDDGSEIQVCYCSLLDDCWELRSLASEQLPRTVAVSRCPLDPNGFIGVSEEQSKKWSLENLERLARRDAGADSGTPAH